MTDIQDCISRTLRDALVQVCGGKYSGHLFVNSDGDSDNGDDSVLKLLETASTKVSVLNECASNTQRPDNEKKLRGKPHDVEIRAATFLYHQLRIIQNKAEELAQRKRKRPSCREGNENDSNGDASTAQQRLKTNVSNVVHVVSKLGLKRTVDSPHALAHLICEFALEELCQERQLSSEVRAVVAGGMDRSRRQGGGSNLGGGLIVMVTTARAVVLRRVYHLLPCKYCWAWCRGEKGLWWHEQQEHGLEHSVAIESAVSERTVLAIVPYRPEGQKDDWCGQQQSCEQQNLLSLNSTTPEGLFDFAKTGNLAALQSVHETHAFDIVDLLDRKGASLLHWAAGSGTLPVVHFLIDQCSMDPNQPQKGKRGFEGRTPLHWASRNGHLNVVEYFLKECSERIQVNAATRDGTTAFGWAAWQGHVRILKLLRDHGADVHSTNSFGCNAVLWTSQSYVDPTVQMETLEWLKSSGCSLWLINSNGHGALHKAAQRGRQEVAEWFWRHLCELLTPESSSSSSLVSEADFPISIDWIGPDTDGCCPSDLAGMAGHEDLARTIVRYERHLMTKYVDGKVDPMNDDAKGRMLSQLPLPLWLKHAAEAGCIQDASDVWEPIAGVRRLAQVASQVRSQHKELSHLRVIDSKLV